MHLQAKLTARGLGINPTIALLRQVRIPELTEKSGIVNGNILPDRKQPGVHFAELDALRGLAAFAVVLWHWLYAQMPSPVPGWQSSIFREAIRQHNPLLLKKLGVPTLLSMSPLRVFFSGSEAVVLFFVLSGFVLSLQFWRDERVHYRPFVIRRIFRIYVPYLAALVLALVGNALLSRGEVPELNQWFNSTWRLPISWSTIGGHVALIGVYDDSAFNTAFWSLIHEMRISLIFPIVMVVLKRLGKLSAVLPLPLILIGCMLNERMPVGRLFASVEVLGLFVLGACIAMERNRLSEHLLHMRSSLPSMLFIISVACYTFAWTWVFPAYLLRLPVGFKDIFVALGAAGLLIASLSYAGLINVLKTRPALYLGKISYSLYLVHGTVLWGLMYSFYPRLSWTSILILYVGISLSIASAFWMLVEAPAQRLGRKLAKSIGLSRAQALRAAV